jgi:hypothetical protein
MRYPDGRGTMVPVHPGRDVAKGTPRGFLADADTTVRELQRLLRATPRIIRTETDHSQRSIRGYVRLTRSRLSVGPFVVQGLG